MPKRDKLSKKKFAAVKKALDNCSRRAIHMKKIIRKRKKMNIQSLKRNSVVA